MNTVCTDSRRVATIWLWCRDAFAEYGHKLTFPKGTDPRKTYQWRYAENLTAKFKQWEFDDQTIKFFIRCAVEYAKNNGLLRKGMSVLCQKNLLQVCYNDIESKCASEKSMLSSIEFSNTFLDNQAGNLSRHQILLGRGTKLDLFNIVRWHGDGTLSRLFLSMSRSCTIALEDVAVIEPNQRLLLPSRAELFCDRSALEKSHNKSKFEQILGNDWRQLCL
jgi:hypothetical protein